MAESGSKGFRGSGLRAEKAVMFRVEARGFGIVAGFGFTVLGFIFGVCSSKTQRIP